MDLEAPTRIFTSNSGLFLVGYMKTTPSCVIQEEPLEVEDSSFFFLFLGLWEIFDILCRKIVFFVVLLNHNFESMTFEMFPSPFHLLIFIDSFSFTKWCGSLTLKNSMVDIKKTKLKRENYWGKQSNETVFIM